MNTKKIFWLSLMLVLFVGGCQLSLPPNIEIVANEDYIKYWELSQNGDYLIYGTSKDDDNYLIDLAIGQKRKYECSLYWWDTYLLGCYNNQSTFVIGNNQSVSVIDPKTLVETPLHPFDANEGVPEYTNLSINEMLEQAELIYRSEWVTDTIYLLSSNYQLNPEKNYIVTGLTNPDEILKKYVYIPVPISYPKSIESPVNSPNDLYYYDFTIEGFSIFTTDNNKIVSEFTDLGVSYLEIGGWAADSSGVYFSTFQGGFGGSGVTKTIYKLKIPNE